jgi:3-deoxy-7-phosphoheptulonate synthase
MIIVLNMGSSRQDADVILRRLNDAGAEGSYAAARDGRGLVVARGEERALRDLHLEGHPLVERLVALSPAYRQAQRRSQPLGSKVSLGRLEIGGSLFAVIAGPPCVETRRQFLSTAMVMKECGAHALRGSIFRSGPHADSFEGVGIKGLDLVHEISRQTALPVVCEVSSEADVRALGSRVTCLQVTPQNMSNLRLLDALGSSRLPVILTRGAAAGLDDLLLSAERILAGGNRQVMLCEQGLATAANPARPTLDLAALPELRRRTHLPLLVDPSRAGAREGVFDLAAAAAACGADGILLDVHINPQDALVGGDRCLNPAEFKRLVTELKPFLRAAGRELGRA